MRVDGFVQVVFGHVSKLFVSMIRVGVNIKSRVMNEISVAWIEIHYCHDMHTMFMKLRYFQGQAQPKALTHPWTDLHMYFWKIYDQISSWLHMYVCPYIRFNSKPIVYR